MVNYDVGVLTRATRTDNAKIEIVKSSRLKLSG